VSKTEKKSALETYQHFKTAIATTEAAQKPA
jgi:hypothetical protein